ncbi:MAG: RHS repeat domain-containing protein [Chthoniobacterales bacterium]
MKQWFDPAGDPANIEYDGIQRVTTITDPLGQVTHFFYESSTDPLKITKVTDPFNRSAVFEYQGGTLWKITDPEQIVSEFGYAEGTDTINSLTTPYGTTQFFSGESGTMRWIEMSDSIGTERVEYYDHATGIAATDPITPAGTGFNNANLDVANSFYWDKKAMTAAPGDYTKAQVIHWLMDADGFTTGIASSEKSTLGEPSVVCIRQSARPAACWPQCSPNKDRSRLRRWLDGSNPE